MQCSDFVDEVNANRGKSGGWPSTFKYEFDEDSKHAVVRTERNLKDKKEFRQFDAWALAFVSEIESRLKQQVSKLTIIFDSEISEGQQFNFEALRRRLSFLALNNISKFIIEIYCGDQIFELYTKKTLFDRPESEVVHTDIADRSDADKGDLLEKAFQAYLFGKDLNDSGIRTNDRLAILGSEFRNVKKMGLPILREFPTGVFEGDIREKNRLTPTEYVDIVSLNKRKELSIIELKIDDGPLEVMSQLLDYALFFSAYKDQLVPALDKLFFSGKGAPEKVDFKPHNIKCYVASNIFHARFDDIKRFYGTSGKGFPFTLVQLVLGETRAFN